MSNRIHKNYLRTCRKKLGLTQRQLASILGLKSSARISAMELGQAVPTAWECIAFKLLFDQSFEELWPRLAMEVEARIVANTRRLIVRLGGPHSQSTRKQLRASIIRENLAQILFRLEKGNLENLP